MKNLTIFLAFLILTSFCKKIPKTQFDLLFEEVFNYISTNYIRNTEISWVDIEKNVKDSIKVFRNNDDVHNAIKQVVDLINDDHGFFLKPNEYIFLNDSIKVPEIPSKIIENDIGYLKIPGFGANDSLSNVFALEIRKALKTIDENNKLVGWIIDLEDNNGGSAFSQTLGISPLFQDSILCFLKDNRGNIKTMKCVNNLFKIDNNIGGQLNYDNSLKNKNIKIAILVNGKTASCGELIALSLKFQNKNTRIFGTTTKGLTTTLERLDFEPSKATLFLSTQYICDLEKNIVEGGVAPDIKCEEYQSLENAIDWIKNTL